MNSSSGRKLLLPVCEILPVATVTAFGIVFACMKDFTSVVEPRGQTRVWWTSFDLTQTSASHTPGAYIRNMLWS